MIDYPRKARCGYIVSCVCVFVFFACVFVRLRISSPRIQLGARILHHGSSASKAGNLTFRGILLPQKPKIGRIRVARALAVRPIEMRRSWNIARRVDVGSACVDIRPSPKTDVLVIIIIIIIITIIIIIMISFNHHKIMVVTIYEYTIGNDLTKKREKERRKNTNE